MGASSLLMDTEVGASFYDWQAQPRADLLTPGSHFARYSIQRCIGAGAMGTVYEATHAMLRKRVALKTTQGADVASEASLAQFLREAEMVARISHPHVVDISDVGIERGIPFLVMELLEGESLAALLAREKALTPAAAVDLLLPAVAALAAVHRHGIVHCDVKPDNLFIAVDSFGDTMLKLIDFGLARRQPESSRQLRHPLAGTPHYMAPEQLRGILDPRTDQYALGVILYECLAREIGPGCAHSTGGQTPREAPGSRLKRP